MSDVTQIPIYKNATYFELFQLKISDESLYAEEDDNIQGDFHRIYSRAKLLKLIQKN